MTATPPKAPGFVMGIGLAPGDRGTEVHVDLERKARGGKLGEAVQKLTGSEPLAKVKDDLRRFKQQVETDEIARSDSTPEGRPRSAARICICTTATSPR